MCSARGLSLQPSTRNTHTRCDEGPSGAIVSASAVATLSSLPPSLVCFAPYSVDAQKPPQLSKISHLNGTSCRRAVMTGSSECVAQKKGSIRAQMGNAALAEQIKTIELDDKGLHVEKESLRKLFSDTIASRSAQTQKTAAVLCPRSTQACWNGV